LSEKELEKSYRGQLREQDLILGLKLRLVRGRKLDLVAIEGFCVVVQKDN
jgi:hypothetical protein